MRILGYNVRHNEAELPAGGSVNGVAEAGNIALVLKSGERVKEKRKEEERVRSETVEKGVKRKV